MKIKFEEVQVKRGGNEKERVERKKIVEGMIKKVGNENVWRYIFCNNGNTCVKGPCMLESLRMTMSCKSVFFGGTEWLNSSCVDWPIC